MRTYGFGDLAALRRHAGEVRRPGRGELLRVRAVSLNHRDVATVLGRSPRAGRARPRADQRRPGFARRS